MIFLSNRHCCFMALFNVIVFTFTTPPSHSNHHKCKFIRLHYILQCNYMQCLSDYNYILHIVFTLSVWQNVCSPVIKNKGDMNRCTLNKNIICILLCIYIYNLYPKIFYTYLSVKSNKYIDQYLKNTCTDWYIFTFYQITLQIMYYM